MTHLSPMQIDNEIDHLARYGAEGAARMIDAMAASGVYADESIAVLRYAHANRRGAFRYMAA